MVERYHLGLSHKRHLVEFTFYFLLSVVLVLLPFLIPAKGIALFNIGHNKIFLTRNLAFIVSSILVLYVFLVTIYKYIETRSFRISLTPKLIEFQHGILAIKVESVDMHIIRDFAKNQSLLDRMLGLANIVIHSEDVRTPELRFEGLKVRDANIVMKYLQANASSTLVEYLMTKDVEKKAGAIPEA